MTLRQKWRRWRKSRLEKKRAGWCDQMEMHRQERIAYTTKADALDSTAEPLRWGKLVHNANQQFHMQVICHNIIQALDVQLKEYEDA